MDFSVLKGIYSAAGLLRTIRLKGGFFLFGLKEAGGGGGGYNNKALTKAGEKHIR
jgi:hypothetical protein